MTATTVSQAVAKREAGPVTIMWTRKKHFAAVLPASVDVEAFLGTAAGALYASADLMTAAETDPDSLIIAMMRCAALGHQPGTDEFYLTPRKKKGRPSVLGIEGYRGIVERMYRSGAVRKVVVREVCAHDKFRYVEGVDDKPVHEIGGTGTTGADFFGENGSRSRGPMVGVYAYAELTTGAVSRVVILTRDDVMAAREASDSKDSDYSPWNRLDGGKDHPEFTGRSMWWKTAARRLEPWVPTSAEYRREQLRAAAAASDHAGRAPAEANGHAPEQVYDAEIVDEPPGPPSGHASGAPTQTTPASAHATEAPSEPRPAPKAQPAGKAALERLDGLLSRLQLGPDDDILALQEWRCGEKWEATVSQVKAVKDYLDDHLAQAKGDADAARDAIQDQFRKAHPA